jgi:selenide,water dikinase
MERDSGTAHAEDAALLQVPPGKNLLQSVDHFQSFIEDPWLFGRIAANHALGDLYAMGVEAHSALVVANVQYGSENKQEQDLIQLLSGVAETLQQDGVLLAGGHSGEAAKMSCGLAVNGFAGPGDPWLKSGMRPGQVLILTRPLGSGVLFAAEMRGKARAAWIDAALGEMLLSNRDAVLTLRRFGVGACTDVTGFGLAGHLHEMARASGCGAELVLDRLPLYAGAADLARAGIQSSLLPQNVRIRHDIEDRGDFAGHDAYPLLFDPQTAGGLLASVDEDIAEDCTRALRERGYAGACIVGRASERTGSGLTISLVAA